MVTKYSLPHQKIVVDPTSAADEIQQYRVQTQMWHRENAVDTARLTFSDDDFDLYANKLAYNDDVAVYANYKEVSDPLSASDLRFYGFVEDVHPYENSMGRFTAVTLRHYGRCILDMLCGEEYGSESPNSGLNTIAEILQDGSNGVIDLWINKILGGASNSGYSLNDTLIENISGAIRYIHSPYDPCKGVIDATVNVVQAIKGTSAGPHYICFTEETGGPTFTTYLLLGTVGAHPSSPNVAAKWPTWWNTDEANSTITVGKDQILNSFAQQRAAGNYVLYQGAYRKPIGGDVWSNNNSGEWGSSGSGTLTVNDDLTNQVGTHSIRANSAPYVGWNYFYYPSGQDWSYDFEKISGKFMPSTLNVYCRYNATTAPTNIRIQLRTGNTPGSDFFYVELYNETLSRSNTWFFVSLPLGDFERNPQTHDAFPGFEGWISSGSPDWGDIDCVEGSFYSGATNTNVLLDGIYFAGYVLRGAKKSGESYYKIVPITDNLAKDDTLKSGTPGTTDIGTLARLAKAELLRASSTPLTGTIQIPYQPTLMAGQKIHVHSCKKSDGAYAVDATMRVTEHQALLTTAGASSTLTLTDDLTNGIPQPSVMDEYNMLLHYVNPEAQTRQISSIKMARMDITQTILEESYSL